MFFLNLLRLYNILVQNIFPKIHQLIKFISIFFHSPIINLEISIINQRSVGWNQTLKSVLLMKKTNLIYKKININYFKLEK